MYEPSEEDLQVSVSLFGDEYPAYSNRLHLRNGFFKFLDGQLPPEGAVVTRSNGRKYKIYYKAIPDESKLYLFQNIPLDGALDRLGPGEGYSLGHRVVFRDRDGKLKITIEKDVTPKARPEGYKLIPQGGAFTQVTQASSDGTAKAGLDRFVRGFSQP